MSSLRKDIGRWTTNPTAQAIRTIRLHLRETQSEFAARFNVWQNSVCRWETGRVTPSPWALVQLLSLATNNEQTQGIRAALDAAGISNRPATAPCHSSTSQNQYPTAPGAGACLKLRFFLGAYQLSRTLQMPCLRVLWACLESGI